MPVQSNYEIAIITLSDWFTNLAPGYQPMSRKTKSINRDLLALFSPRFEQVTSDLLQIWIVSMRGLRLL